MRKFIYQSIVQKLQEIQDENETPVIQHFDIWNNNLEYLESEQPFNTPAVFVEFMPIEWRHQGGGVRDAAVTVALHVVTRQNAPTSNELPYAEQSLQFFDILTSINRCLHRYSNKNYDFGHNALTATQSLTDHDCGELRHDIEVFTCHATDASAMSPLQTIPATPVINT